MDEYLWMLYNAVCLEHQYIRDSHVKSLLNRTGRHTDILVYFSFQTDARSQRVDDAHDLNKFGMMKNKKDAIDIYYKHIPLPDKHFPLNTA